jgi:hypothetical protein
MAVETQRKKDVDAIRGCVNIGMPALMNDRSTLDIRQSSTVIGMVAKSPSSTRYIYIDGRKHPDADELEAPPTAIRSPGGRKHAGGRYDRSERTGITAIPGGGVPNTRSHLVEQYRLSADGQQLVVTFT